MSESIDPAQLKYELAIRGMNLLDLAKRAGLSPATTSAAGAGRRISAYSIGRIADVFVNTPVNEVIKRLLGKNVPASRNPPPVEADD